MENKLTKRIGILYFSPTNTTKKICKAIASGMGDNKPIDLNLTIPEFRKEFISNANTILENINYLIVGAPVYEGKLPVQVIECLNALNGDGKECTLVVVYGNRDYGIALRYMAEMLIKKGFNVLAAGAFIGQHSYIDLIPIAVGRPDKNDLELAFNFGQNCLGPTTFLTADKIPQQFDMISKSKNYNYPVKTRYVPDNCEQCGLCAKNCPTGIISPETGDFITKEAKNNCIGCMACVSACKNKARVYNTSFFMKLFLKNFLKKASIQRLEPLTIFA